MKRNFRPREMLYVHYYQETKGAEWQQETVIATCEAEARARLRNTPGKHDPDRVFDSAIDSKLLTRTVLVQLQFPKGSP